MTLAPKRRWFRFSLRTLFVVVTMFGVSLGYELNWIRQRHEVLADPKVHFYFEVGEDDPFSAAPTVPVNAPWFLRLLGERGVASINIMYPTTSTRPLSESEELERARVSRLFPETTVTALALNF
jgi:hypothetical protein